MLEQGRRFGKCYFGKFMRRSISWKRGSGSSGSQIRSPLKQTMRGYRCSQAFSSRTISPRLYCCDPRSGDFMASPHLPAMTKASARSRPRLRRPGLYTRYLASFPGKPHLKAAATRDGACVASAQVNEKGDVRLRPMAQEQTPLRTVRKCW